MNVTALGRDAERIAIAAPDPVQDIPGIIEAARLYAGDLDVAPPYVSRLNGDFRRLAPMIVFSGTPDLLNGNCRNDRHDQRAKELL